MLESSVEDLTCPICMVRSWFGCGQSCCYVGPGVAGAGGQCPEGWLARHDLYQLRPQGVDSSSQACSI